MRRSLYRLQELKKDLQHSGQRGHVASSGDILYRIKVMADIKTFCKQSSAYITLFGKVNWPLDSPPLRPLVNFTNISVHVNIEYPLRYFKPLPQAIFHCEITTHIQKHLTHALLCSQMLFLQAKTLSLLNQSPVCTQWPLCPLFLGQWMLEKPSFSSLLSSHIVAS